MKKALIIRHVAFEDAGSFTALLLERHFAIQYVDASMQNWSALDPVVADLCIVLGGPIGAYEDENYPFIQHEICFLQRRLQADLPTLGICLGSQMMARAMGARVYSSGVQEIGWYPLQLSDAGKDSSLRHLAAQHTTMFHWHGDTFDLPEGAELLASSAVCKHQAYRRGKHILAFQCHPEVTAQDLEAWYVGNSHEIAHGKISIHAMRREAAEYGPARARQAGMFLHEWLDECGL